MCPGRPTRTPPVRLATWASTPAILSHGSPSPYPPLYTRNSGFVLLPIPNALRNLRSDGVTVSPLLLLLRQSSLHDGLSVIRSSFNTLSPRLAKGAIPRGAEGAIFHGARHLQVACLSRKWLTVEGLLAIDGIMTRGREGMTEVNNDGLLALASEIVASHVANNKIAAHELPQLIREVYQALLQVNSGDAGPTPRGESAIPINKSVTPGYLVCLEDGRQAKMLKRHLRTAHNLSPDEYRRRWGLPGDYPMVASNYAKTRSKLAKEIGLGRRPRKKKAQPLSSSQSTRSKQTRRK